MSAVLVPQGCPLIVDVERLHALGVRVIREVAAHPGPEPGGVLYDPDALVAAIRSVVQGQHAQLLSPQQQQQQLQQQHLHLQ